MISVPSLEKLRFPSPNTMSKVTVAVQWDSNEISYLVVTPEKSRFQCVSAGLIARDLATHPFEQLAKELKDRKITCRRLIALLSRSDLEIVSLKLPSGDQGELPAMVASMIEEQIGDSESEWITDFTVSRTGEDQQSDILAFTQTSDSMAELSKQAQRSHFQLLAVVPRSLASIGLLRRATTLNRPRNVAISFCNGQIDIAVMERARPILLRTVPLRSDSSEELAKRCSREIQRCLAADSNLPSDDPAPHVFVFGTVVEHQKYVEELASELGTAVSLINPLDHLTRAQDGLHQETHRIAPLLGAAYDVMDGKPEVDMVHPRQAPKPPNPIRRRIAIGVAVAFLLSAGVYVLWQDKSALAAEVDEAQTKFDSEAVMANKMLEKADDLKAIEAWMQDEVNWLDELRDFSEKIPPGEVATIRRFSGSTQNGTGKISLAVQVSDPGDVAMLENRLRGPKHSVTSNRVSERGASEEYPWQFETRLAFDRRSRQEYRGNSTSVAAEDSTEKEATESAEEPVTRTADRSTDSKEEDR